MPVRWGIATLPVPHHDPAQVRGAAQDILHRAEFQPSKRSWWSAAVHWVLNELGRLLGRLVGIGGSGVGGWVVVAVLIAIVVAVVLLVIRYWVPLVKDPLRPAVITAAMRGRSAVDWRAEAARHEREGRWRDALRCRYRALVADLAGRGVVQEVPGRTAGEYRTDMQVRAPGVATEFAGATELFENAWYGDRPTGAGDQARFDELAGRVMTGVTGGPS